MNVWIGLITFAFAFFFFEKAFMWPWIISSGSRVPYTGLTNFFLTKLSLKMSPTVLFIHLKIILLQYF